MSESKYGKYIVTELKSSPYTPSRNISITEVSTKQDHTKLLYLDNEIIKGAFYVECVWIWPGDNFYPVTAEPDAHTHDFDEVITFFGSDANNPYDLCGEIEFWFEDEKHILTRSCLIFVPKGIRHCPLVILKVNKPIFHFAVGPGKVYSKK